MGEGETARVTALYRYPVKGLSAEKLDEVDVEAGATLPFGRAFAIENGPGSFDPLAPCHVPKAAFLMLMRNERLAQLEARFEPETKMLEITRSGTAWRAGNSISRSDGR